MTSHTCIKCLKTKWRILGGRDGRGQLFYVGSDGKRWKGRQCPECFKIGKRGWRAKPLRAPKPIELLGSEMHPDPLSSRQCRRCLNYLPVSRYFTHLECQPLSDAYEATDWGYGSYLGGLQ